MSAAATPPRAAVGCLLLDSPIGTLTLEGTDAALLRLWLPHGGPRRRPPATPGGRATAARVPLAVAQAARQLGEYFGGRRTAFDVPLQLRGTPFQRAVWTALGEIPYGETVSYAELAHIVGHPRSYRAVGQANGANPIPIVLACHRVLASGGGLGGYGGGLDTKRALLALEGLSFA